MGKLNKPFCATEYGNTGFGDCFLEVNKFEGAFQVPSTFEIAEGDIDDLETFLNTKVSAGIGVRIFPYHNFVNVTDNTEDSTINTTDYGAKIKVRDGFYDWTFRYLSGGVLLHQEIAKNAGSNKHFLFYDSEGILYGYKAGGKLKGIPVDIFDVAPWRLNTGGETALYTMRFIINPKYLNKGNLGFLRIPSDDFNLFDVAGLQTIALVLEDTVGNNTFYVSLATEISGVDLYDAYSATLAVGAWTLINKETGATIAITSVTPNAGLEQWVIVANAAAMNLLDPGDIVQLSLVAPTVLAATPYFIEGFEAAVLDIAVPSS